MNIGIYSPYFSILGGGEKYLLSIAQALSEKNDVTLFAPSDLQIHALNTFNIDLKRITFVPEDEFRNSNSIERYFKVKRFDRFFYMTDGSLFYPSAKKNYLLIQSPAHFPLNTLSNRIKFKNWDFVCYSQFMADIIKKKLNKDAHVLSPCVEMPPKRISSNSKEKIILTVGRFFPFPHCKKHEILIAAFKKLSQRTGKDWKFVIIGGLTEYGGKEIYQELKKQSTDLSIEIFTNVSFTQLTSFYRRATFYWHATGFGEDLNFHPERAEHFGITTLEAMSYGAIPLVFDGGGQKDIIVNGVNGYLWQTIEELYQKTMALMDSKTLQNKIAIHAFQKAEEFSCTTFNEKLKILF